MYLYFWFVWDIVFVFVFAFLFVYISICNLLWHMADIASNAFSLLFVRLWFDLRGFYPSPNCLSFLTITRIKVSLKKGAILIFCYLIISVMYELNRTTETLAFLWHLAFEDKRNSKTLDCHLHLPFITFA